MLARLMSSESNDDEAGVIIKARRHYIIRGDMPALPLIICLCVSPASRHILLARKRRAMAHEANYASYHYARHQDTPRHAAIARADDGHMPHYVSSW